MTWLKNEYRKQEDVVGGDVRNIVTIIGNIVDMTETSNGQTSEGELIDIAQVEVEILPSNLLVLS